LGELCADKDIASRWADEFLPITRDVLSPEAGLGDYFKGTSACLSALLFARRNEELITLIGQSLKPIFLNYRAYAARALAAMGRIDEAISMIEDNRGLNDSDYHVARICEPILLAVGRTQQTFLEYGFEANRMSTFLATYRALRKKYSMVEPKKILTHCINKTPGEEGKWFAAARHAGFLDVAQRLATEYRTEPKTLTNAARDHALTDPEFAVEVGISALRGINAGYSYDEPSGADVLAAYDAIMRAAEVSGKTTEVKSRLRALIGKSKETGIVRKVLARRLDG
jgi:hypothetical protein